MRVFFVLRTFIIPFSEQKIILLPQKILYVAFELDGLVPTEPDGGLTDVLFVLGGDGATTEMVFVVALAIEVADEMLLQRIGYTRWHIIVDI